MEKYKKTAEAEMGLGSGKVISKSGGANLLSVDPANTFSPPLAIANFE